MSKRIDQMFRFFSKKGKGNLVRNYVLDLFTTDEIVQIMNMGKGRGLHELAVFINTNPKTCLDITAQEVEECKKLLRVSETMSE